MKKIFAGAILVFVILLEAFCSTETVYASTAENQSASYELAGELETTTENETEVEEDAEVLGAKRDQTDRFIIGIEIAISLTFLVGLIAASHGAEVK
ncbi:hypothetical protein [Butyrivibrio sp. FC2001]|uniref:hypothetical protein n=1 Tax=Butyrivibrio sp. FC2001 TaxID=1280671 RepID=UPI00047A6D52|nr:hypothetical protein [Butyrivibrio sp. FC2001]